MWEMSLKILAGMDASRLERTIIQDKAGYDLGLVVHSRSEDGSAIYLRHRDHQPYQDPLEEGIEPEDVASGYPLRDAEVSLTTPNRNAQNTAANCLLERLEEKLRTKNRPIPDAPNLCILEYNIHLKRDFNPRTGFWGLIHNLVNRIVIHYDPKFELGTALLSHLRDLDIQFYAFVGSQCHLLCENNPDEPGYVSHRERFGFPINAFAPLD